MRRTQIALITLSFVLFVPCAAQILTSTPGSIFSWEAKYGKKTVDFTAQDWLNVIDTRWGAGLSIEDNLKIFDIWWRAVDEKSGVFTNADIDIDAIRDRYRPEIEAGVSRGRFAAIMNHFGYQLQDLHTYIWDTPVRNSALVKGVPMLVIGQYGVNRRFGAVLSPLPDSTLVVYRSKPNHPLGLVPGDVVLGYDGVLWKDIYPTLIEAELPLFLNIVSGSNEATNEYYLLQAAGLNWHLFDTIDILRYSTGQVQHFSTNALAGQTTTIWGSDHVNVPGVTWPNRSANARVGWGVVDGTNIGYVFVTSWSFNAQYNVFSQFRQAIDELVNQRNVDGLIIDQRFNTGGGALGSGGWSILFNTSFPTIGFDIRSEANVEDHLAMQPDPLRREENLFIIGNPNSYFDKPIAGLIGPGAISAGELETIRLRMHPRARLFGKGTAGGNSPSYNQGLGDANWFSSLTSGSLYRVEGHEYMIHKSIEPDYPVWLEKVDVANGIDTVVQAAIAWIQAGGPLVTDTELPYENEYLFSDVKSFPNPFRDSFSISVNLQHPADIELEVYDLLGRRMGHQSFPGQSAGPFQLTWNSRSAIYEIAPGLYFFRLSDGKNEYRGTVVKVN